MNQRYILTMPFSVQAARLPMVQTYKTLAAMTLAQQVYNMISMDNHFKIIIFATLILAPGILCGELTWYAQVAVVGFCIAIMKEFDAFALEAGSCWGEKALVAFAVVIGMGHLTQITRFSGPPGQPLNHEAFKAATIGLPAHG
jgi:hypothetical protein